MAKTNQEKLDDVFNRTTGGIPNKPYRPDTRVADNRDIEDLPRNLVNHEVPWYGFNGKTQPKGQRSTTTLGAFLGWIDSGLNTLMTGINKANEGIAGLTAAVKALSEKQGVDPVALSQLIDKAVSDAADKHLSDIGTYELRKVEDE